MGEAQLGLPLPLLTLEHWLSVWSYLPTLLQGLSVNLALLGGLLGVGFVLGVIVALLEVYGPRGLRLLAAGYAWVFRSIPEILLLLLMWFGPAQFGLSISPFTAAVLALGLRSSAYQAEIFRGALQAIPTGQTLAARALGFSRLQAIRYVLLPQALRLSLAGWGNEFAVVLKDTTLAYAIGVVEVMRQARYIGSRDFPLTLPAYILVAMLFLVVTYFGLFLLGNVEKRLRIPGLEARR
ncbi:MAG: amino acid ABC transporter permease [Candidatus Bipolaricaulaceae bacterium]